LDIAIAAEMVAFAFDFSYVANAGVAEVGFFYGIVVRK